MVLATIIPSNGARSGGVILPIVRSISELYGSSPGADRGLLGSFLMTAVYQGICITAAMFMTGQASNPMAAQIAGQMGYTITWSGWFVAGIVPGLCSLLIVPWVVMQVNPPEIRHTPQAAEFARNELRAMGALSRGEWMLTVVFVSVCGLWVTSGWHGIDITVTALCGAVALLLTGVLTWDDVKRETAAWDIFIWYGGLLRLGKALNDAGVTTALANGVGGWFPEAGWILLFVVALLIYFYAHYGFASITAHILAMYPAFLAVLSSKGRAAGADGAFVRLLHEPFGRLDQLRNHAVADVLRARVRVARQVVAGGLCRITGEHHHLVHHWVRVVEADRDLVISWCADATKLPFLLNVTYSALSTASDSCTSAPSAIRTTRMRGSCPA
jgi:divalent anion:Na+ symporter, DASS family